MHADALMFAWRILLSFVLRSHVRIKNSLDFGIGQSQSRERAPMRAIAKSEPISGIILRTLCGSFATFPTLFWPGKLAISYTFSPVVSEQVKFQSNFQQQSSLEGFLLNPPTELFNAQFSANFFSCPYIISF